MSVLASIDAPAALTAVPNIQAESPAETPANESEQPVAVECPAWRERHQEHVEVDDVEHATLELKADQAGQLISASAELMALSTRDWRKKTALPDDNEEAR